MKGSSCVNCSASNKPHLNQGLANKSDLKEAIELKMKLVWLFLMSSFIVLTTVKAARIKKVQPRALNVPLPCDKLDIIIVLDQTESVGSELCNKMKTLAKELMDRFFVSHLQTHLDLITFGRRAKHVDHLQLSQSRSGRQQMVEKLLNKIPNALDSITNLEEGLQVAFDAHKNYDILQNTKNYRTDARNVVIIFTDGKTYDKERLESITKPTHGVTVIAVALGDKRKFRILNQIADDVVVWTYSKGTERDENEVLKDIMDNFNFIPCESTIPKHPKVGKFGCYSKTTLIGEKAMYSMENDKCWLMVNESTKRDQAFEKCAWLAWKRGYNTFGVDGQKRCSSGFIATRFYKGGSKNNCQDKLGGSDSNIVYYFKEIAPQVAYGLIGCLTTSAPVMTSIANEKVNRMPGEVTAEKCAWAARTQLDYLFTAVTSGETVTGCSASRVDVTKLFTNLKPTCSETDGESQLFFVGADAPCVLISNKDDIAIMVDLYEENIQFLVTLVDSLEVADRENRVGVIATQTAKTKIEVKFSDQASHYETALLGEIRDAAKTTGFTSSSGDYNDSLTRVQEIFTPNNGDRKASPNVLLIMTDTTKEFTNLTRAVADKISALKKDGVKVVVVGFGDDVTTETENKLKSIASKKAAVGINTMNRVDAAFQYYKKRLNDILMFMCK